MTRKKLTFEAAMKRIEEIAITLEQNEISLDESIKLYKEGMELTLFCKNTLTVAEKEVLELKTSFENNTNNYELVTFDKNGEM